MSLKREQKQKLLSMTFLKPKNDDNNNSNIPTEKKRGLEEVLYLPGCRSLSHHICRRSKHTYTHKHKRQSPRNTQRKETKEVEIYSKIVQDRQAEAEQLDRQRFRLGSCSGANRRDDLFPGSPALPLSIPSSHCRPPLCPLSQFLS